MHYITALCTHTHTHLAIHALQDNHMQTQTHSANQACTHKTTGYTYIVAQPCASTYTHIWLSMHYKTTPCKHEHTQIQTHARTKQFAIHALPHSTMHAHTHTFGYPCTATQHCARAYTHIAGYPCTTTQHCACTYTHMWLSMHCHTALPTHIHTHLAIHALQHNPMQTQTHSNTQARMHAQNKLSSMHCYTALCTHIHTHLAIHALQHSTVHAHTHTSSYTCTATQHCARTHTFGYPCTKRQPHENTNTFRQSSMHTQDNWLHIHCRTAIC